MSHIGCMSCNGNGVRNVIKPGAWGFEVCPDCDGTGADMDKTRITTECIHEITIITGANKSTSPTERVFKFNWMMLWCKNSGLFPRDDKSWAQAEKQYHISRSIERGIGCHM